MKDRLKYLERIMVFALGFLVLFSGVNHVLVDKTAKKTMYGIRYEKKSMDVMFFGNSHASNAFLATELYEKHGITAYNMGMMSQTFPLVYYTIEDAFRFQKPKVVVVDLFAATSFGNDFGLMHVTVDNLTFKTRLQAIREFIPKEKQMEYYFPFYLWHDRWKSVEVKDFLPYFMRYSPRRNARKGVTIKDEQVACEDPMKVKNLEPEETTNDGLSEQEIFWLQRIKTLCEEKDAQLFFVVVPYSAPVGGSTKDTLIQMELYSKIQKWCEENAVDYLSMFEHTEEMQFDYATDMYDSSHVNVLGAQKITTFLGDYISEHYELPDSRLQPDRAKKWDEYYRLYSVERDAAIEKVAGLQMKSTD